MAIFITITLVFSLLCISELSWRKHKVHDEFSRKFVHITVGGFVAFWPYFLSWDEIRLLSLAFLIAVGISKQFNLFKAIHAVSRPTWGEIFFAISAGLMTFVTNNAAIYTVALLQMGLADGLAAVIGTRYGKHNQYKIFGHAKSLVGAAAFFITSYSILLTYFIFTGHISIGWCLLVAAGAAGLENLGVQGIDNLLVPLFVALMLIRL